MIDFYDVMQRIKQILSPVIKKEKILDRDIADALELDPQYFAVIKRPAGPGQPVTAKYIKEEQKQMLEKKYKFAPTVREIRKRERRNMMSKGKKPNAASES